MAAEKAKPKLPAVELPKPPAVSLPKPAEVKQAATDAVQAAKDAAPASVQDAASEAAKGAAKAPSTNPFSFFGGAPLMRACSLTMCANAAQVFRASALWCETSVQLAPRCTEHGLLASFW